eukprot:1061967-Prymnesium_polylepis.1
MTRAPNARRIAVRSPCTHSDRTDALCGHLYSSALKSMTDSTEWLRIAVRTPWAKPWRATVSRSSSEPPSLPRVWRWVCARLGGRSLEPARCAIRV